MIKKVNTKELQKGDVFLTKGVNLDSPFDEKLMAICNGVKKNGIKWRSYSPEFNRHGGIMSESGYIKESKEHFEVEKIDLEFEKIDFKIWSSLVILNKIFD